MDFAMAVRVAVAKTGMKKGEAAKACQMPLTSLSMIMRTGGNPTLKVIENIADGTGCSVSELMKMGE